MIPGEVVCDGPPVEVLAGRPVVEMVVSNGGDRPIQVGSHYHFAEANPALRFDRAAARGRRLAIPAGTSVRFEPGIERTVGLVELGGRRVVLGLRGEVAGPLDPTPANGGNPGGEALDRPRGAEGTAGATPDGFPAGGAA